MKKLLSAVFFAFSFFYRAISRLLRYIFGSWQLPPWLHWTTQQLGKFGARARANPRRAFAISATAGVVLASAFGGYWRYTHLPQPVHTEVSITAPSLTTWKDDKAIVAPLIINFSDSAAPLEAIGKEISKGITLSPKIVGTWQWETESRLVFKPLGDWPVGAAMQLKLDRPPHWRGGRTQRDISICEWWMTAACPLREIFVSSSCPSFFKTG